MCSGFSTWPYMIVERGAHADAVRGGDDLDPGADVDLLVAEDLAHVVVEDLRRGAGDRAEAGVAQHAEM